MPRYKISAMSTDSKIAALQIALQTRDPFCAGLCPIQDYQRFLHYTDESKLQSRRIHFSDAESGDLDALYRVCKRADSDESYHKVGKMDLTSFSTLLDPRGLGIHDQVSKALLTESYASMDLELSELNIYAKGDFFRTHRTTPRNENILGSLIVILPTLHEGGQSVLRRSTKEWTINFTDKFASSAVPSVCFLAFESNVDHEILAVTSGYRVTLTYNLYHKPIDHIMTSIPTPFHLRLRQALVDLVNDTSKLPEGGYLGLGLVHEYVHTRGNLIEPLLGQLKGSDRALVDTCDALGLRYSIRLFYRDICDSNVSLLTTEELDVSDQLIEDEPYHSNYLEDALRGLSHDQVEGVYFVDGSRDGVSDSLEEDLKSEFYKDPVMEMLEVTPMKSSVDVRSPILTTGGRYEKELQYFYGTACVVITVEPVESRRQITL